METQKPIEIREYLEIALRQKWYIIIPLVCSMVISFGVYKYLPKVYKATTLILVQPQRIPEDYVRPTVTESVAMRLNTISQEILSRTRLEKVIQELNLFPDLRGKSSMEDIVETMRHSIEINVQENRRREQNSFSISFLGKEPNLVMTVTNKLASLFIEENLKVREKQAEGTSDFLNKELVNMEGQLKKKEDEIRNYKERNMGQLPSQLDANLRILEGLRRQLQTANENVRAAEDRSLLLQEQIEMLKKSEPLEITKGARGGLVSSPDLSSRFLPGSPLATRLDALKRDLFNAQSKYKENHPDIVDLKKKIADLEPQVEAEIKSRQEGIKEDNLPTPTTIDPAAKRLLGQYKERLNEVQAGARRFREEIKNLEQQIASHEKRIEDTPRREQELILLTRDYDLMEKNYQSLLNKKIQAELAENLERTQQGERFRVLDPARLPEKPFKPDRNRILLIGAMIGLMAGLGLIWFRESLDRSFHSVSDVEVYLAIPVIATIPNLQEEKKSRAHAYRR